MLQPFHDSSRDLGSATVIRDRAREQGYLFFRGLIPHDAVLDARRAMLDVCAAHDLIDSRQPRDPAYVRPGMRLVEGQSDEWYAFYADLLTCREVYALAWQPALLDAMRALLDADVLVHGCGVFRTIFPDTSGFTKPPHQDWRFVGKTARIWAAWIPCGDCPLTLGALRVLVGSHRHGELPVRRAKWGSRVELPPQLRWAGGDMQCGDVLMFSSFTVHCGSANLSGTRLRLSADFRYQPAADPVRIDALQPHLGLRTWDEIYAQWAGDVPPKYYWRDLPLEYSLG
jgi:ectoine hydroxylase-related dioxygenase (phytanoyl-CoA dioxygenase family)